MSIELFKKEIVYSKQYLEDISNFLSSQEESLDALLALNGTRNLLEAIEYIEYGLVANPGLIKDLINPESASLGKPYSFNFFNSQLDDTQQLAVKKALSMNNLLLIQGPPGAGKSTTIVEMIRQIKKKEPNSKILVTSQTHVAVDNVLEKLLKNNFNSIVRLAAKTETNEMLKDYYLTTIFQNYLNNADEEFKKQLNDCVFVENYSNEGAMNSLLRRHSDKILLSKDVIGITANALKRTNFQVADFIDYAIVDEVGKITFPELMFIARFVKKLILIGDPKQLPATLFQFEETVSYHKEAYNHFLNEPFISFLFEHTNPDCKVFLNKQYRMAKEIGNYISDCFYTFKDTKLQNGVSTISNPNALNFVDYDANNCIVEGSTEDNPFATLDNPYEIKIISSLLESLKARGVDINHDVAIISPYADQVKLIKNTFPHIRGENIDSVDAFQGRENKIVIFSCSRNKNVTSFFKKPNRINVAISRAISEVWVIGSKDFCLQVSHLNKYYFYNKIEDNLRSVCNHYYFDGEEIKRSQP